MCAGRHPSSPAAPDRRKALTALGICSRRLRRNSGVHGLEDGFRQAGYCSAVGNMACISGARAGSTATPEFCRR
eukprot:5806899-Prorocentrum_lima.AAC.1